MELYFDKDKQLWRKVEYNTFPSFLMENIQTKERKYIPTNVLSNRDEYKRFVPEELEKQQ